jgi:hypothetical protein
LFTRKTYPMPWSLYINEWLVNPTFLPPWQ